jgi:PBSX family phage terminase large subunit
MNLPVVSASEEVSPVSFEGFDPYVIPMQARLMDIIYSWDYASSTPEIFLSGAYGSSKSIIAAHLAVRHCLDNPGAVVCICRRSLPDIKKTIYNEIVEHIQTPNLKQGVHYKTNETRAEIRFCNGSKIISASWADRKYKKFRSLKISMAIFEEAAENDEKDKEAFMTIKARLRRLPHVKENIMLVLSNPDEPDHWLYEYFIEGRKKHKTRLVLYSITTENPFLPEPYVKQLLQDLTPLEAQRFIYGLWISLLTEVVYSCYNPEVNYLKKKYKVDEHHPIGLTWDFNIGDGKPMSAALFQHIDGVYHFFNESVIKTARTENTLDDLDSRGLLDYQTRYIVYGDAAGKNKCTRSKRNDYQIIYDFLERKGIEFEKRVPPANPPIRQRHNDVNRMCLNALKQVRLYVYETCPVLHKGFKQTKLKKGAGYIEDDSFEAQHITTAAGYGITRIEKEIRRDRNA